VQRIRPRAQPNYIPKVEAQAALHCWSLILYSEMIVTHMTAKPVESWLFGTLQFSVTNCKIYMKMESWSVSDKSGEMWKLEKDRWTEPEHYDAWCQSSDLFVIASSMSSMLHLVKFVSSQWCAVSGYAQGDDKSMDSDCAEHMIP